MRKTGLCFAAGLLIALSVQAQEKDSEPNISQVPEMPTFRPDLDQDPMSTPKNGILSYGVDPKTGKPMYYIDPESKLYFDFKKREIRDFTSGEIYSFDEFSQLLKRKKPEPKPEEKTITV